MVQATAHRRLGQATDLLHHMVMGHHRVHRAMDLHPAHTEHRRWVMVHLQGTARRLLDTGHRPDMECHLDMDHHQVVSMDMGCLPVALHRVAHQVMGLLLAAMVHHQAVHQHMDHQVQCPHLDMAHHQVDHQAGDHHRRGLQVMGLHHQEVQAMDHHRLIIETTVTVTGTVTETGTGTVVMGVTTIVCCQMADT